MAFAIKRKQTPAVEQVERCWRLNCLGFGETILSSPIIPALLLSKLRIPSIAPNSLCLEFGGSAFQRALNFSFGVSVLNVFSLVAVFLSFGEPKLELEYAFAIVPLQGHQSQALFFYFAYEIREFRFAQKKFARAVGPVVERGVFGLVS